MTATALDRTDSAAIPAILALLRARTGVEIPSKQHGSAAPAIRRAMLRTPARSMTEFHAILPTDAGAFDALVDELTVGETYFFRDTRQFALLRERIIPAIVRSRRPDHAIAVWSAGCASGEEPYSIAMVLNELGLSAQARVVGTDVSTGRLESARAGSYSRWSLRGVAPAIIHRYFRRSASRFELMPAIRSAVRFSHLNLGEPFPAAFSPARFDLIVCRNVLIYFDAPAIARVVQQFAGALADGGWLLLGPSDPPIHGPEWEVMLTDAGLVYRRRPRSGATEPSAPTRLGTAARSAAPDMRPPTTDPTVRQPRPTSSFLPRLGQDEIARPDHAVRPLVTSASRPVTLSEDAADPAAANLAAIVREHANAGRASAAALLCIAALEAHPAFAELHLLSALLMAETGDGEAAARAAKRALYLDARCPMAHIALGSALIRGTDEAGARRSFHNAMRLLDTMESSAIVPASGGETVASIRGIVRSRLRLLDRAPR